MGLPGFGGVEGTPPRCIGGESERGAPVRPGPDFGPHEGIGPGQLTFGTRRRAGLTVGSSRGQT